MSSEKKVTVGSGNVFADLGFANPEEAKQTHSRNSVDHQTSKTYSSQSWRHT